jgi:hypothetical protein
MNERIRELTEQARNYALDEKRIYERMHNTEQCMEEYREVYNKKFAELIVRECMNAVCDPRTTYLESMTESSAMYTARERIRKHFGG